jgi:hypothetical protein
MTTSQWVKIKTLFKMLKVKGPMFRHRTEDKEIEVITEKETEILIIPKEDKEEMYQAKKI